jgi:quercetin dioxygenase-like cupin family protein
MLHTHEKETNMMVDFTEANLELSRERVLSFHDVAGVELYCTRGALWLTQEGGGTDVVLTPGEAFIVERDGVTLVSGLNDRNALVVTPRHRLAVRNTSAWIVRLLRKFRTVALRRHPAAQLHGC